MINRKELERDLSDMRWETRGYPETEKLIQLFLDGKIVEPMSEEEIEKILRDRISSIHGWHYEPFVDDKIDPIKRVVSKWKK